MKNWLYILSFIVFGAVNNVIAKVESPADSLESLKKLDYNDFTEQIAQISTQKDYDNVSRMVQKQFQDVSENSLEWNKSLNGPKAELGSFMNLIDFVKTQNNLDSSTIDGIEKKIQQEFGLEEYTNFDRDVKRVPYAILDNYRNKPEAKAELLKDYQQAADKVRAEVTQIEQRLKLFRSAINVDWSVQLQEARERLDREKLDMERKKREVEERREALKKQTRQQEINRATAIVQQKGLEQEARDKASAPKTVEKIGKIDDCDAYDFQVYNKTSGPIKVKLYFGGSTSLATGEALVSKGGAAQGKLQTLMNAAGAGGSLTNIQVSVQDQSGRKSTKVKFPQFGTGNYKTLYLSVKDTKNGFEIYPQTGKLGGIRGITESGCKVTPKDLKIESVVS